MTNPESWYKGDVRAQDDLFSDKPFSLDPAELHGHFVQMYEADHSLLVANVGRYIAAGLGRGQSAIIIATPAHRAAFAAEIDRLGTAPGAAERDGRLILLDAADTLSRFIVGGYPNAQRFDSIVGSLVRDVIERAGPAGLLAYGEMVGILWQANEYPAAIRLEQLWNRLRKAIAFDLYCSYPIDVFGKQFEAGVLDALLSSHTHLLPCEAGGALECAIERAIDEELGSNVRPIVRAAAPHRSAWPAIPKAEATILWLREHLPEHAETILTRARGLYQATA